MCTQNDISEEIKKFIHEHVDSVARLEILLLLAKNPTRQWTGRMVSQELRSNESAVEKQLVELVSIGFVARVDGTQNSYIFKPKTDEFADLIQKLVETYLVFHLRVIQLIYEKPAGKLRSFADAFRFRKDGEDG